MYRGHYQNDNGIYSRLSQERDRQEINSVNTVI